MKIPAGDPVGSERSDEDPIARHVALEAVMSRASSENFPVAMRVLPSEIRGHLKAVYGYARLVDDLGDEYPGDRAAALDWAQAQLDGLFADAPVHPVFAQLAPTVNRFGMARQPFEALLDANRLDQSKTRYADWDDLMHYCTLSANPVGRLVLAVFDADTPERIAASDDVCSALQVLEHLQDVGEDAAAGRVYLPADEMQGFGVLESDLSAPAATAALRGLVAYESSRARALLHSGRALVSSLSGWARLTVSGFVAGGLAGLDALAAARFDVLARRPRPSTRRTLLRLVELYRRPPARSSRVPAGW